MGILLGAGLLGFFIVTGYAAAGPFMPFAAVLRLPVCCVMPTGIPEP